MSDLEFIKMLTILSKRKTLTNKSVNTQIEKFFPDYADNTALVKIRKLVPAQLKLVDRNHLEEVLKMLDIIYALLYENHATLDHHLTTDIRRVIAKRFGESSAEHVLSKETAALSYKDKGRLIKKNADSRTEKHKEVLEFSGGDVFVQIEENIDEEDVARRAVALGLACGSREVELCAKSTYTVSDGWIRQDFIAKSKSRTFLEKPILFLTPERFIEEVEKLRVDLRKRYKGELLDDEGNLKSAIASLLNTRAKQIMGAAHTFNSTRKEYSQLSHQLIGKFPNRYGEKVSDSFWRQQVLGHAENDLNTGQNYHTYVVQGGGGGSVNVDILEAKVDKLEDKIEECCDGKAEEKTLPKQVPKTQRQYEYLEKVLSEYEEKNKKRMTQNELEKVTHGTIPRSVVRIFHAEHRSKSLF